MPGTGAPGKGAPGACAGSGDPFSRASGARRRPLARALLSWLSRWYDFLPFDSSPEPGTLHTPHGGACLVRGCGWVPAGVFPKAPVRPFARSAGITPTPWRPAVLPTSKTKKGKTHEQAPLDQLGFEPSWPVRARLRDGGRRRAL